jgi:hypothetical protein
VLSESELPMRLNLSDVAASSAYVPPSSDGSRIRKIPSNDFRNEHPIGRPVVKLSTFLHR